MRLRLRFLYEALINEFGSSSDIRQCKCLYEIKFGHTDASK